MKKFIYYVTIWLCLSPSSNSFSWGERGHDLITRVAARLVDTQLELSPLLVKKEHMLAHMANVPDIVWRNADKKTIHANSTTHYIGLDSISPHPTKSSIPLRIPALLQQVTKQCKTQVAGFFCPRGWKTRPQIQTIGSAPFRIEEIYQLMVSAWSHAKKAKAHADKTAAINNALFYAGVLSHFVGDLANPHHTVYDYDGWNAGQGGIHSYFESKIISALPLGLSASVFTLAKKTTSKKPADQKTNVAIETAFMLALDSFENVTKLNLLDKNHAIIERSQVNKGLRVAAKRHSPEKTARYFEKFAQERLSAGAIALAHLWQSSYLEAGKPDLSDYHSYDYPVKPEFIPVSYTKD